MARLQYKGKDDGPKSEPKDDKKPAAKSGGDGKDGKMPSTVLDHFKALAEKHQGEREALHSSHRTEHRDMHGNHKAERDKMHSRHQAARDGMNDKHQAEMAEAMNAPPPAAAPAAPMPAAPAAPGE